MHVQSPLMIPDVFVELVHKSQPEHPTTDGPGSDFRAVEWWILFSSWHQWQEHRAELSLMCKDIHRAASGLMSSGKNIDVYGQNMRLLESNAKNRRTNEELSVGVLMATSSPVKKSVALRQNFLLQFYWLDEPGWHLCRVELVFDLLALIHKNDGGESGGGGGGGGGGWGDVRGQVQETTWEPVSEWETGPSREMGAVADKRDGRRKWWRWRAGESQSQLGLLFLL